MRSFEYVVKAPEGIHARPATLLAQEARKYKSKIKVEHGDVIVNAADIIALFRLRANQGAKVTFFIEGEDEEVASQCLLEFCEKNL